MTTEQAKNVLKYPDKIFVLTALSFVNLGDEERNILMFRHMQQHTQEQTAEEYDRSVNHIQNKEKAALEKCAKVWGDIVFVKKIMGY